MRRGARRHRWVRGAATATLLVVLGLGAGPARAEHTAPPRTGASTHIEVSGHVSQVWIEVALKMGELIYHELAERWGVEPPDGRRRLRLVLYPSKRAFMRAMALAQVRADLREAGGFTLHHATRSHVWLQRHGFDTRRLIVHELTHQMQNLCMPRSRARDRRRDPWWYREGLAEYLGHHRVTREGVELGAIDVPVSFSESRDAAARVRLSSWDGFDLAKTDRSRDYVDALALVAGLSRAQDPALRRAFRAFEREVIRKGGGGEAFERHLAPFRAQLTPAVRAVWAADGPPIRRSSRR